MTIRLTHAALALLTVVVASVPRAHAQVVHTPNDHIPNFAANPTLRTATSGPWSSAASSSPARVPGPTDVVSIAHTITYDSTSGEALVIGRPADYCRRSR